ncbi:MAG TPA: TonB-dependent receptor [Flavisolibacter sp.]|nr:TonB-dependent receptor [Flavisolibacter sp.]
MRKVIVFGCLAFSLNGFAQFELAAVNNPVREVSETPAGAITGTVLTTDNQPASFVTVSIKENGVATLTDENGFFAIKGLQEGVYTLEISMVGLKPQQKQIEVKKDKPASVTISLSENAKQLTEVVVVSGKRLNNKPVSIGKIEVHPMDLPQSMAIVGQGLIREQQAQRLSDVIKNVNGVYMTTARGNVQESFGARGYSLGSTNLFKNGSRINSGVMPEMSSLERVEVLKGSSAILYGQVAPGGIVNMVTKQPKFTRGGEVSMRIGSYDLYKPSFDFYGPLSSSVAYRINGTYETANSFRDKVSSERYYINPSLLFKLGDRTDLVTEGDFLKHNFTPDFGIGSLDNTKIPDVPRSRFMGTAWQYSKTEQTTATVTLRHRFNDVWKLNTSFAYQLYKRDYYSTERIQALANGDWTRTLGKILTDENYYTGQVNLVGKFATGKMEHNLLAGVDADKTLTGNNDFRFPAVANLGNNAYDKINILDPGKYQQRTDIPEATHIRKRKAELNRVGVYAQDLIKLTSKLNVMAGIRWSYVETVGIDSTNLLNGAKTQGKTRFDQAFSPRVGLVYKPTTNTSLFASYSNSFVVNSGQDIYGKNLEPSIIDQYEVGVKNELFNGKLSANVTLYRIVNNNLAQTAPFLLDGSINANSGIKMMSGQTTSDGVEVDLAAHLVKGLDVIAGYSYNFMRFTKTDTTHGSFKTGERLVNNPAHTANGSVFYTVPTGKLKGFKAGVTVMYVGERFGGWNTDVVKNIDQSTGQIKGPFTYRSRIFEVDGFTTIDVSAGYSWKKVSLLGKVSNLTNSMNWYVHENYSINPIPPTQFVATVSYKF